MQTIFTVGHSTRTLEELVEMLKVHGVGAVADVRRYPGSRKMPWFAAENLASVLPKWRLEYWPFVELGGRRKALENSINTGWRSEAFRGYADYMQTTKFQEALDRLMPKAQSKPTVIMCAEAVPWRCHRSLIADALLARGWEVRDIFDVKKATTHKLTQFARVEGTRITYPAEATEMPLFKK